MLSDEEKRALLEAAGASLLRDDFDRMSANVREAGKKMSLDDYLIFLAEIQKVFGAMQRPPVHERYPRALL